MKTKGKNLTHIAILILLVAATFYVILKDENMDEIYGIVKHADLRFVLLAVLFGAARIYGEAFGIHMIMRSFHKPASFRRCIDYAGVGFLFSGITPSASGGQPAQLYYMGRDKQPLAAAGLCLILMTIVSRAVMVLFGIAVFAMQGLGVFPNLGKVKLLFYLGLLINTVLFLAFLCVLFSGRAARKIGKAGVKLLAKWHLVKKPEQTTEKLLFLIDQYEEGADYIKEHKMLVLRLFLLTFAQRCMMYMVPYFIYRSFGLEGESAVSILMLQSLVAICSDMLPLPGGIFANEKCYMTILQPVMGAGHVLPSMLLSRGISFYFLLILSACIVVVKEIQTVAGERNPGAADAGAEDRT